MTKNYEKIIKWLQVKQDMLRLTRNKSSFSYIKLTNYLSGEFKLIPANRLIKDLMNEYSTFNGAK